MTYKTGDYVKVVKIFDRDAEYYYDYPRVIPEMFPMQNKVCKITFAKYNHNRDCEIYHLELPDSPTYYVFTPEMLQWRVIPVGNNSFVPYNDNAITDEED